MTLAAVALELIGHVIGFSRRIEIGRMARIALFGGALKSCAVALAAAGIGMRADQQIAGDFMIKGGRLPAVYRMAQ